MIGAFNAGIVNRLFSPPTEASMHDVQTASIHHYRVPGPPCPSRTPGPPGDHVFAALPRNFSSPLLLPITRVVTRGSAALRPGM